VKMLRLVPLLGLVLFLPHRAAAQAQNVAPQLPGCSWKCYSVTLPYGLYVKEVVDGGSYVVLEDGSVWRFACPSGP